MKTFEYSGESTNYLDFSEILGKGDSSFSLKYRFPDIGPIQLIDVCLGLRSFKGMKPRFVTEGDGYSDFCFDLRIESGPTSTEFLPSFDRILILSISNDVLKSLIS